MSNYTGIGKPEVWLNFFGAMLGSIFAIIGAYILSIISDNERKKKKIAI